MGREGSVLGRVAASTRRLSAPRSLKASSITSASVTLKWAAPKGTKPARYVVLRDGKSLGKVSRTSYTDHKVVAGKTYRYSVRAVDARGKLGAISASVRVKVPRATALPGPTTNTMPPIAAVAPTPLANPGPSPTPTPTPSATPTPTPTPTPPPIENPLTQAMVDRLFWRAGFGPPVDDTARAAWNGKPLAALVDWFLETPSGAPSYNRADKPPRIQAGAVIDPLASDLELELEWIDRMSQAVNPFPDRLAFFWHRHWAVSREDGAIPPLFILRYRDRLLRYAEFVNNPGVTFKDLALEMTTSDAAMSMYLNMNQNVRGKPNENYAREFMELFCLGPTGPDGTPNYSQDDVGGLAKAFTGWTLNTNTASVDYGKITFSFGRYELTAKTFLGLTQGPDSSTAPPNPAAFGAARINEAVDKVLAHPNHPQFLIRKLWAEFIASPIPPDTLNSLVASYKASGFALKPLLRAILMHPLIFESLTEPNLVKPPVIAMVGALRALKAPLRGSAMESAMIAMQQRIYNPPNVAGWEGGLSWLNTNTVQARFSMAVQVQTQAYGNNYDGAVHAPTVFGNTVDEAWTEALKAAGSPWVSAASQTAIKNYAASLTPMTTNAQKIGRFYAIQALILGGPDGQVM